jgi:Flp pilus assembly protein TadG
MRIGRLRSERGAELIEFALIVPLLVFVIMALVDFGFLLQRFEVVNNAAREGARMAVLPGGYVTADVEARVLNYISTAGVPYAQGNPTVVVTNFNIPAGGAATMPGKRVQVNYSSAYLFLGPLAGWFGGSFTSANITAVAIMRNEL